MMTRGLRIATGLFMLILIVGGMAPALAQEQPQLRFEESVDVTTTDPGAFTWQRVVNILYGLVNFLFVLGFWLTATLIAYYGITIMLSGTNLTKIDDAKKGLWYAILGFAVIMAANIIVLTLRRAFQ